MPHRKNPDNIKRFMHNSSFLFCKRKNRSRNKIRKVAVSKNLGHVKPVKNASVIIIVRDAKNNSKVKKKVYFAFFFIKNLSELYFLNR